MKGYIVGFFRYLVSTPSHESQVLLSHADQSDEVENKRRLLQRVKSELIAEGSADEFFRIITNKDGTGLETRDDLTRSKIAFMICRYDRNDLLSQLYDSHIITLEEYIHNKDGRVSLLEYCAYTPFAPKCFAYFIYLSRYLPEDRRLNVTSSLYLSKMQKNYLIRYPKNSISFERALAHFSALAERSPHFFRREIRSVEGAERVKKAGEPKGDSSFPTTVASHGRFE